MNTEYRTIIVHCHIFKNAGTTFDWSLERYFGSGFLDHRDDNKMRRGKSYLGPFLKKNKHIIAISSHHIKLPLPELKYAEIIPAFILRHPVARVGSVYAFERKQDAQTPGAMNAKVMTFLEYVRWRMEPKIGASIRNFQARYCSGRMRWPFREITESDFEVAQRSLINTPLIGLVEMFDESMVVFEEALKEKYPDIDLSYIKQNVGDSRVTDINTRVNEILNLLSPEVGKLLLENNQFDFRLYDSASSLLQERMADIKEFDRKLELFQERCNELDKKTRLGKLLGLKTVSKLLS